MSANIDSNRLSGQALPTPRLPTGEPQSFMQRRNVAESIGVIVAELLQATEICDDPPERHGLSLPCNNAGLAIAVREALTLSANRGKRGRHVNCASGGREARHAAMPKKSFAVTSPFVASAIVWSFSRSGRRSPTM